MSLDEIGYAHLTHRQDVFSEAYIRTVCAAAGCSLNSSQIDNDKIDLTISSRVTGATFSKPKIDFQLKCERSGKKTTKQIPYSLDLDTYDNLRDCNVCVPRMLLVVFVPDDITFWLRQSHTAMRVSHCAYWHNLKGAPASLNSGSQTVYVPRKNIFGPNTLRRFMSRIADGQDPE